MFPTLTAEEIEQRWITQRGKTAADWQVEVVKRRTLVKLLLDVCSPSDKGGLSINGSVCFTAAVLFQYFRTVDPTYTATAWAVATAALFLATKLHNYNKTIHDVCRCSLFFRMGIDPGYKHKHHLLHDREFVEQHVAEVRACESDMLVGIGFDLNHPNPMMRLARLAQSVGGLLPGLAFHTGLQTPRRTPRASSSAPTASGGSSSSGAAGEAAAAGEGKNKDESKVMNIALGLINDSCREQIVLEYNAYELAAGALFLAAGVCNHQLRVPPGSTYAAACSDPNIPGCQIDTARLQSLCISMKAMYKQEAGLMVVDVPQLVAKYSGQHPQANPSGASSVPAAAAADKQPPPADVGKSPGEHSIASSKTTADPPATGQAGAVGGCAGSTASPTSVARDGTPVAAPAAAVPSDHKQRPAGDSSQASAQKRKRTPEESAAAVEPLPGTGEPRQKRQVSFALPVAT